MSLITLLDGELAFGDHPLLDRAQLSVETGERIGLIGRNGSGKSSLLRVLAGIGALDVGQLQHRNGLKRSWVEQEPELPSAATLRASLQARASAMAAMQGQTAHADDHDERDLWRLSLIHISWKTPAALSISLHMPCRWMGCVIMLSFTKTIRSLSLIHI